MKLLLLNTCGAEASFALADTELSQPVVVMTTIPGRTASEGMVAAVRAGMAETGWTLREPAAIGVVTGPGSFTGVRVGLSVAKGLSEASGVPLIAVSRLAMLAATGTATLYNRALLDAGRGEFYSGLYRNVNEFAEALMSRQAVVDAAGESETIVVCEESVAKAFEGILPLRMVAEPTAADALPFAVRRLESGEFDDPMTLDANYLRRTDAEIFANSPVPRVS